MHYCAVVVNFQRIPLNENSILPKVVYVPVALEWIYELTGCFVKGDGIIVFFFLKTETALNVLPQQLCILAIQKDVYFLMVQSLSMGWQLKNWNPVCLIWEVEVLRMCKYIVFFQSYYPKHFPSVFCFFLSPHDFWRVFLVRLLLFLEEENVHLDPYSSQGKVY